MPEATTPIAAGGERKFVVVMFADLTGYTDLCRRLDPEDVAATVWPVMAEMRAAVEAEGGVVPSVAGDGFMAVFGVPASFPDAADRALRAAQNMRTTIHRSNAVARPFRIPDVHIGITAGEVLVVPSSEPVGWSLVGTPVNFASRLCDAAAADEVLVDEELRALAGVDPTQADQRLLSVAGAYETVPVWSITGAATEAPATALTAAEFVNRDDALRQLDIAFERVATEGVGAVLLVAGETGIGKSRLLRHWLEQRGHQHVWTWCGASHTDSPVYALAADVAATAPAAAGESLEQLAAAQGNPSAAVRSDPFPAVLAAVRRLFEATVTDRPLVVALDDAHLGDSALRALLDDLRDRPLRRPLLLLATWRTDDARSPWPPDIQLDLLSAEQTLQVLTNALGSAPPASVADTIVQRIGGHPLMAVQSAAYLVETGVLRVVGDRCELRQPDAVDVLPTSLRLFVAARIDRLDATAKAALQELSTFGELIDRRDVEELCGPHILGAVPTLVERGLLRDVDRGWRFAHGLVQQVAYASLPRSIRAELHRRWLRSLTADSDSPRRLFHALRWAEHSSSGDPEQSRAAVQAALDAAYTQATRDFAIQSAAALATVRQVSGLIEDNKFRFPVECCRLSLIASRSLLELGRFEEALAAAETAAELADGAGAPVRLQAMHARGHALSRLRRFQAARQVLDEALALAEETGDDIGRAQTFRLLGDAWRHTSYQELVNYIERAYDTFEAARYQEGATECACILAYLRSLSTTAAFRKWRDLAAAAVDDRDLRNRLWLARADLESANMRSNTTTALTAATEAVRLGRLLGAADGIADGLAGLVRVHTALGRLDEALEALDELRRLAVTTANPRMRLVAATDGLLALLRAGRLGELSAEEQHALSSVSTFGSSELSSASFARALVARDRGRWPEAAQLLQVAKDAVETSGGVHDLTVRLGEAVVHLQLTEPPTADYLVRLAAECREAGSPALASYAEAVAEQRAVLTGESRTAAGPDAAGNLEEQGIRADSAALLAERDGGDAAAAWAAAGDIWARLGATIWLARAQARSGTVDAAEATLRAIGADDAGRDWAFSSARG